MAQPRFFHRTIRVESKLFWLLEEGQLDGLAPKAEKRFLLPFLGAERQAGVAAERAELHELPAPTPEVVHASVAQDFTAMGALMGRARSGVAGTNQGAIR